MPPPEHPSWQPPFAFWTAHALLAVGLFAGSGAAADKPAEKAEKDITAVLTAQQDAWNRGDLDGFMAGYWVSEELRFASGDTVTTGFKATKARYEKRYKADGKEMGKLAFSDVTVELVTAEYAVVRGRWALKFEKSADEPHGLYTLTVKKFPDGWKITSDHTSAGEKK
jgi:beta-aspartyl-peptidase (threonine type)